MDRAVVLRFLSAIVVSVALAGCSGAPQSGSTAGGRGAHNPKVWFLVPNGPDRIDRVVVDDGKGRRSEVRRSGPVWIASPATPPVAASLMLESQAQVLPLGAYKRLESNPPDPRFGLDSPLLKVSIDGSNRTWTLAFGGRNFNGAGYYVKVDGDPLVYLVPRRVGDDLLSVAVGNRVDTPRDPRETKAIESYNQQEESDEVTNPWLHQALEVQPSDVNAPKAEPLK